MSYITAADFQAWKADPVTQAYMEACRIRIEDVKDGMSTACGLDPVVDNFNRGFVYAYREMLDFRITDMSGEEL